MSPRRAKRRLRIDLRLSGTALLLAVLLVLYYLNHGEGARTVVARAASLLLVPYVLAAIVWMFGGRSQRSANITFFIALIGISGYWLKLILATAG